MIRKYAFDVSPRCSQCNKKLAEKVTRPWQITCGRCKFANHSEDQRVDKMICIEVDNGCGYTED